MTQRRSLFLGFLVLAWCAPVVAQDTTVTSAPLPAVPTHAAPATLSYGIETAFRSGHSDRGFLITDRPGIQPALWLSARATEFSLWGNLALDDATDGSRPDIVEAELSHKIKWKTLAISPAARLYSYQDRVNRSNGRSVEAWVNLTNDIGPFALFTNQSVDVLDNRGGYFGDVGVEYNLKLALPPPPATLGVSLVAGWANATFNDYWAGVAKSAFDRVGAEVWLTIYPAPHFYIAPHVELSSIVDRQVRAGDLFSPTYLLFRLTTGVEF